MAVSVLMASEYRGTIKSSGLPLPGVTVTATQGDKKVVTTTDERGAFYFPDLADGVWTLEADMLGFARLTREVGVARVTPSPEWEMKLLSQEALLASLAPAQPASAVAKPAPPAPGAPAARGNTPQARNRPLQPGQTPAGFQRLDVNQSADASVFGNEGALRNEEMADLNQSASNSLVVQGSMSSALGMPQQADWRLFGPGMGGMDGMGGPGMMGMGGPGMMGTGGPNGDGAGPQVQGGPRGPGGFGGPAGGPGMRGRTRRRIRRSRRRVRRSGRSRWPRRPRRRWRRRAPRTRPRGLAGPRRRHGFRQRPQEPAQHVQRQRLPEPGQLLLGRPLLLGHRRQPR